MGCFEDKGYEEMVDIISPRDAFEELKERSITYVATQPVSQRALPAEEVGDLLVSRGCSCRVEENVIDAYEYARNLCCDLTIALGSIYLIGDFRILYQEKGW
jgi:dihydrofolate synthase/folylpolyglutamate synthase